jgi:D-alanyl-D-alanine dipeptidase
VRKLILSMLLVVLAAGQALAGQDLPEGFVYLKDVAPDIVQDVRYAGDHNFLGRPVQGYQAPACILTKEAAQALKGVQADLRKQGLGLKVFDCYRPQRAVDDFVAWSADTADQATKAEFYPRVDKKDFFDLGYVAKKSGHSRGSTMDLTIIAWPPAPQAPYVKGQALTPCTGPYEQRFADGGLDMGTGFDCMDELSHSLSHKVSRLAQADRAKLRNLMVKHGFAPYEYEWWHFTLKNEPFPQTYFDFPVAARK